MLAWCIFLAPPIVHAYGVMLHVHSQFRVVESYFGWEGEKPKTYGCLSGYRQLFFFFILFLHSTF